MYKNILSVILSVFDIPSDTIVGVWSLVILVGCIFSILKTHEVSAPVATIFSVVITNFAGHKIVQVWKGTGSQDNQNGKNLDVQGDKNANSFGK